MHNDLEKILFDEAQLAEMVERLGREITRDYAGEEIYAVGILKGAALLRRPRTRHRPARDARFHAAFELWRRYEFDGRCADPSRPREERRGAQHPAH